MLTKKRFLIGKVNLIVAKLTANEGYFVWTSTPVSISERKAIVKLISDKTMELDLIQKQNYQNAISIVEME